MKALDPSQILYEDNHLLVVNKPAGIATQGAPEGDASIADVAASYLKQKYNKPGNVFVGVVSRLDSRVSGVLVLARTSKAASRLSEQIRERSQTKKYLAWVEGDIRQAIESSPTNTSASNADNWIELTDWIAKNEKLQRMEVVQEQRSDAKESKLRFRILAARKIDSLIEVELITGRKHQIRLQLASIGHSIVGDQKYEAQRRFRPGIALHSHQLTIDHPTKRESMTFRSSPVALWSQLPPEFVDAIP